MRDDLTATRCITEWMKHQAYGENSLSSTENGWTLSSSDLTRQNMFLVLDFIKKNGDRSNHIFRTDARITQFDAFLVVALMNDETLLKYYGLSYDASKPMKPILIARLNAVSIDEGEESKDMVRKRFTLGMNLWGDETDKMYILPE